MPTNVYIFEEEDRFQVRLPNEDILAEFSIQQLQLEEIQQLKLVKGKDYYQAHLKLGSIQTPFLERLPIYYGQGKRILVYHGLDKRKAIESAYQAARYLASRFDKDFDDLTNLAENYTWEDLGGTYEKR